jgi:RNA polymerase sigma factor (sigma-70 family)
MYLQTDPAAWAKADRFEAVLSWAAEHASNATQSRRFQAQAGESVAENLIRGVLETAFPSAEEERREILAWRDRADISARDKILAAHLPLVWKIARVRRKKATENSCLTPPMEDLLGEGWLALHQAITSFDPGASNRFAAYAKKWVDGAIGKYIRKQQSVVKGAAFDELIDPLRNDDEYSFDAVDPGPSPEEKLAEREELSIRSSAVRIAIESLGSREGFIFESRRLVYPPVTLRELADKLGISIERVRQLEMSAFRKVRERAMSGNFAHKLRLSEFRAAKRRGRRR